MLKYVKPGLSLQVTVWCGVKVYSLLVFHVSVSLCLCGRLSPETCVVHLEPKILMVFDILFIKTYMSTYVYPSTTPLAAIYHASK